MSLPNLVTTVCVFGNVLVDIVVPARAKPSFFELALEEGLLDESLWKFCHVYDWHRRIAGLVEVANGCEGSSFTLDAEGRIVEG